LVISVCEVKEEPAFFAGSFLELLSIGFLCKGYLFIALATFMGLPRPRAKPSGSISIVVDKTPVIPSLVNDFNAFNFS